MLSQINTAAALAVTAGSASAENIEVRMLNRGEAEVMVFEPSFVKAQPGDVIRFVPTDKGHNLESIEGMLPDDAGSIKTKFNQEFGLAVAQEGLYGQRRRARILFAPKSAIESRTNGP